MAKLAVVNGAVLRCDKGSSPSPLAVTTDPFTQVDGAPVATILDNKPGVNVRPFGVCAVTKAACVPVTPGPWQPGEPSIPLASPFPLLSDDSLLVCSVGGIISITSAGQSLVAVDSPGGGAGAGTRGGLLDGLWRDWTDAFSWGGLVKDAGLGALPDFVKGVAGWASKSLGGIYDRYRAEMYKMQRGLPSGKNKRPLTPRQQQLKMLAEQAKDKARFAKKGANAFKWVGRKAPFIGKAIDAYQIGDDVVHGKWGDAAATGVGVAVAGGCAALAVGGAAPTFGASLLIGAGCGVAGSVAATGTKWAGKQVKKLLKRDLNPFN